MNLSRVVFTILFLLVMTGQTDMVAQAARNRNDGWIVNQSSNFAGTVCSEITPSAMRMRIGKLGVTIITHAPDWNVCIYNENNRTYAAVPKGHFAKQFALMHPIKSSGVSGAASVSSTTTGRTQTIAGHKAVEVMISRTSDSELGQPAQATTDLWIASDIAAPPEITQVFCQNLNIPVQKKIPLRMFLRQRGTMVCVLETLTIKPCRTKPETFALPPGFKKLPNEMAVIFGDEDVSNMMGSDLGSGSPTTNGRSSH